MENRQGKGLGKYLKLAALAVGLWNMRLTLLLVLGLVVDLTSMHRCSRATKIKIDLKAIVHAAELMEALEGKLPENQQAIKEYRIQEEGAPVQSMISLEQTTDPWGNEYLYEVTAQGKPLARCLGRDQREGGEGEDRDYQETPER